MEDVGCCLTPKLKLESMLSSKGSLGVVKGWHMPFTAWINCPLPPLLTCTPHTLPMDRARANEWACFHFHFPLTLFSPLHLCLFCLKWTGAAVLGTEHSLLRLIFNCKEGRVHCYTCMYFAAIGRGWVVRQAADLLSLPTGCFISIKLKGENDLQLQQLFFSSSPAALEGVGAAVAGHPLLTCS